MGITLNDIKQAVLYGDPVALCTDYVLSHDGLVKLPIPRRDVWVVSHPEYVEQVLASQESGNFGKGGDILDAVAADLGVSGLFNVNDFEQWRVLRRLTNSEFHVSQLGTAVAMTNAIWEKQMDGWERGQPVRLHDEFVRLNLHYLMIKMFGQTINARQIADIAQLAEPVFADMFKRIALSFVTPTRANKLTAARDALDRVVREVVARPSVGHNDLLQRFKAARQDNPLMTDEVIRDQVFTLLMAGFDSTATVTSWAAIELAARPEWFGAVRSEVLQKLGADRPPTYEDIQQLPVLLRFLKHVLRVHPAFPLFFRDVRAECTFGGRHIKKGATLVINLDALHHSTLAGEAIPFGAGSRKCPAERLAMVNMAVPIVKLLQRHGSWQNIGNYRATRYTMTRWPRERAAMMLS